MYCSLLEKDESGDVPWLAERWSMDGNDYTFTLFENAQFQDGEPLTTADVAFTLDYYQEHPPVSNSLGTGEGWIVDHYTVEDEQTITITVKEATDVYKRQPMAPMEWGLVPENLDWSENRVRI